MPYCSVKDLRDESVGDDLSDLELEALIDEASSEIDRITGWFFDPRSRTYKMDGTGTRYLHLPAPIISITEIQYVWRTEDEELTTVLDPSLYVVYNRTDPDDRFNPKIMKTPSFRYLTSGVWKKGIQNFDVTGTFGFVDDPGGTNTTPAQIKRACKLLVLSWAKRMGESEPGDAADRMSGDLRSISVRGRSAQWAGPTSGDTSTGLPVVDRILLNFRRPPHVSAA